jgi:hypothetical protein
VITCRLRRADRGQGLAAGRAAAVEPGAEDGEHVDHVLDQVVLPLGVIDGQERAPVGGAPS